MQKRILTTRGYRTEDEMEEDLFEEARTPHEDLIVGGTPKSEFINSERDFYTPYGILSGELTIKQARELRRRYGFFVSTVAAPDYFRGQLVLTLEDLNPNTGETIRDPIPLGEFDERNQRIIEYPHRDLATHFRDWLRRFSPSIEEISGYPFFRDNETPRSASSERE